MKKRIFRVSLVLLTVLSLCLSSALPVMAADPEPDNQPVAWLKWTQNSASNKSVQSHQMGNGLVKLLADETTAGHWFSHNFETGTGAHLVSFIDSGTKFYQRADGAKVGEFQAYVFVEKDSVTGQPITARWWFQMVDNGEPTRGTDEQQIWVWLPDYGYPVPRWWPMYGPQNPTNPLFGVPVLVMGGGNIQVHLGE